MKKLSRREITMAAIKSYTDLEQSKKLAEILPHNSADMHWQYIEEDDGQLQWFCFPKDFSINQNNMVSAWSLSALLSVVSEVSLNSFKDGPWIAMVRRNGEMIYSEAGDPVDACYELILKLHEENLL